MPRDFTSTASEAPKEDTNALVAPYMQLNGHGWHAAAEEVKTTQPRCCFASMRVTNTCVICTALTALHSTFAMLFPSGLCNIGVSSGGQGEPKSARTSCQRSQ